MSRQIQKYECETCGVKGEVIYFEGSQEAGGDGVIEVFYKIKDDHKRLSPGCDKPAEDLHLLPPWPIEKQIIRADKIEVIITTKEQREMKWPGLIEAYVIRRLKAAGIPITGTFCFTGIKTGTLWKRRDISTNDMIFTWLKENPSKYKFGVKSFFKKYRYMWE